MQPRDLLTPREVEVATLVWEGLTNRDIAKELGTTEQVVKNYLRTTFDSSTSWEAGAGWNWRFMWRATEARSGSTGWRCRRRFHQ